jgi:hypothetical protein
MLYAIIQKDKKNETLVFEWWLSEDWIRSYLGVYSWVRI